MADRIRVIDFETTGVELPEAEVVEVGWCDLTLAAGAWTVGLPSARLCGVKQIPPETRAVHHITMAEVEGLPPFQPDADLLACVVLAGHNVSFEAQFLAGVETPPLLCTHKAALRAWPEAPGFSNGVLRYWLEDQGLLTLDHALAMPPHRAGPDAYVTAHVLKALLATGITAREMVGWQREPCLWPTCPIGDWRGRKWADVDAGFLRWITNKAGMDPDIQWNARRELDRRGGA